MSAIHRIDDMYALPGRRFFNFASRLPAYAGVMQARAMQAQRDDEANDHPGQRSGRPVEGGESAPALQAGQRVMSLSETQVQPGARGDGRGFPAVFQHVTKRRKGGG